MDREVTDLQLTALITAIASLGVLLIKAAVAAAPDVHDETGRSVTWPVQFDAKKADAVLRMVRASIRWSGQSASTN